MFIYGEVIEIQKITDFCYDWKTTDRLFVDLDNCLFEANRFYGHADWFYGLVEKRMNDGLSKTEAVRDVYPLWIEAQKTCEVRPVEPEFVALIQALQEKGVRVMGFTHRQPSVVDSTVRQVRSLGLEFDAPSSWAGRTVQINGPALCESGILFVGDYNKKGDVLAAFLDLSEPKPERIVFMDDKRKNVEELEPLAAELKIDYLGVHYTAIDRKPRFYTRDNTGDDQ